MILCSTGKKLRLSQLELVLADGAGVPYGGFWAWGSADDSIRSRVEKVELRSQLYLSCVSGHQ